MHHPVDTIGQVQCLLGVGTVIARSTEGAEVPWIERTGWCDGQWLDVIDARHVLTTDIAMAAHALITIPTQDLLTQFLPYLAIVEATLSHAQIFAPSMRVCKPVLH